MISRIIQVVLFLILWAVLSVWEAHALDAPAPSAQVWMISVPESFMITLAIAVLIACIIYYIRYGLSDD
jgi:hypothetical protein